MWNEQRNEWEYEEEGTKAQQKPPGFLMVFVVPSRSAEARSQDQ